MTALFWRRRKPGRLRTWATLAVASVAMPSALAQVVAKAADDPLTRSAMDAPLFYQLLLGEMQMRSGEAASAYEAVLDAARRTRDEALFRRAAEIALQGRAGEQALAAARAWRTAHPGSGEALRLEVQLLTALNRGAEAAEPIRALLATAPAAERPALIAALPRLFQRAPDKKAAAVLIEQAIAPYAEAPATRTTARVAIGRGWLAAGNTAKALSLIERALADEPLAPGPALLALEMTPAVPAAERLVQAYLERPKAEPQVRLAYVRALTGAQRYTDAVQQLERAAREQPQLAPIWLNLGALQLELKQPVLAEKSLLRYVELAATQPQQPQGEDDDDDTPRSERGLVQAWLMLAQAAEQRGDFAGAERWLQRVDNPQRALEVQTRRASLLVRQNKVDQARELIRRLPERGADDARAKLLAEAQVMRDAKRWKDAHDVLAQASQRFAGDADLLYEQAMAAEKLNKLDEMEALLKKVIELKPEHHHAYNALGYSLADRNQRLDEARTLISKALQLAPGDPFITDSMGWVEYRMGNRHEALRLLRAAYGARPDTEIAAHLGEVLWVDGQHEEARRVLREARGRDADNEVLRDTLARLKVDL